MTSPLPARGRHHFDGQTYDKSAYNEMRRYEQGRGPWLAANPGKDLDDYHEWFNDQELKHVHSHRHFQA